jgi:nicotinate dehydrogenase subunit A
MATTINVNGQVHVVDVDDTTPLLYILRNDLKLKGARFGCGIGACGACTVVIDGNAVQSCDIPLSAAAGRQVTTIEGIGSIAKMHALQSAFIAEQAAQCGYCTSGIVMTAYALLERNPRPSESEIRTALDGNLCRCGSHGRVLRAVKRAAQELAP